MAIVERRNRNKSYHVEPELLDQGIRQLQKEIQTLNIWIQHADDSEEQQRRYYEDMLRSRNEMLRLLTEQKNRLQADPSTIPPGTDTNHSDTRKS